MALRRRSRTELGRVGGLRVIAPSTAFRYRDKTAFREIARELGVGLVVRGSVQRAGETVRIDVSLIDTRDETALWSERYSRELTNVLAVQDEISRQIATTLAKTFSVGPKATVAIPRHDRPRTRMTPICAGSGTSRDAHPPRRTWPTGVTIQWQPSWSSNGQWLVTPTSRWRVRPWPACTRSGFSMSPLTLSLNKRRSSRSSGPLRSTPTKPRRISRARNSPGTCATVFPTSEPSSTCGVRCRSIPIWPKCT